jgi:proteasome activator subunit 4
MTVVAGGQGSTDAEKRDKHAVIMGLQGCIMSAPYDIPSWLPKVLIALVRAASEPPPIGNSARSAPLCRVELQRNSCRKCHCAL